MDSLRTRVFQEHLIFIYFYVGSYIFTIMEVSYLVMGKPTREGL